ncbi:MAG TPA: helix-turn-helix transcriptional regulator, partial [Actinomycetota bacterium]
MPNQLLIDHRKQRGWSQQDLVNELVGLGNRCGERNLGLTFKQVSRWEQGWARPRPPYTKLLCLLFEASANELGLHGPAGSPAQATAGAGPASPATDMVRAGAGEPAPAQRTSHSELLELTVMPAVAVEPPRPAWEDMGVEPYTMEFPRLTDASMLPPDTLERLE